MAADVVLPSSRTRGKRKADKPVMSASKVVALETACFYDPTLLNPALHELYTEKAHRLFIQPEYRVNIAPTDTEKVLNHFEIQHAATENVVRIDGRLQLCYGVWNQALSRFEYGSRFLNAPQRGQTCIIFAARFKVIPYHMSHVSEGDFKIIASRFNFKATAQLIDDDEIAQYPRLFNATTDDLDAKFAWSESPEPAQIEQTCSWLQRTIFPPEIVTRFELRNLVVIPNDVKFDMHDARSSIEVHGKTDALLVRNHSRHILAVIEIKKRMPTEKNLRQLWLKLYAAMHARSDRYSVFGVLTDLDSYWYIQWFDTTDVSGIDIPRYLLYRRTTPAISCIRALVCGNMKLNRKNTPKYIIFFGDGDTRDDEGNSDGDEDHEVRKARRSWKRIVNLKSTEEIRRNRTDDTQAPIAHQKDLAEHDEPLDMELYQKLEDVGFWKWHPDLSEMPDADNPVRQQQKLASAMADLAGLSRNEMMADVYERIQENRRHEEERARESSRLAADRLRRLQSVGVM